jgi:hypothetical protein
MLPPRTESEAFDLIQAMEAYYRDAFAGFAEDDLFYEGQLDKLFKVPPGFDPTIPTTARAVVDEAVDNVAPADVLVTYAPRGVSKAAEQDADLCRRYIRNLIQYWRTSGNDIDIVRDFLKNLFKSGKAVFKVAPDWSLWPQLSDDAIEEIKMAAGGDEKAYKLALKERVELIERVRSENVPIYCRSISPACIMEDPTVSTRKLWIIERYDASPEEIRNTYAVDSETLREYHRVSFPVHEVWTATYIDWEGRLHKGWHYVFVNWECIRSEENPYDELPYVVKYSGFGREAYEGKPEYKSVGFFTRQTKSMLLAQMRRFTHLDAIMSQLAFPIAFLDQTAEMHDISFAPGAVNFVPERTMANIKDMWVQPRIPDAEYMNSLNAIAEQIERGTVQRAIRGAGVPGTTSAAQYGAITSQARLRLDSAVQATEQALSWVASMALKYIDRVLKAETSIFVAEDRTTKYTIGPKNIRGRYMVQVKFQPNEDAIKERKLVLANDAIVKGGLSPYDAYVYAGFDNPTEMIARKMASEVLDDPLIRRWLAKQLLAEWGEDADAIEMDARAEEAAKQMRLRELTQALELGTMRGGFPVPGGNEMPLPPEEQAAAPQGPPGVGLPGVAQGAPAGIQQGPVQAMMNDIGALQDGV